MSAKSRLLKVLGLALAFLPAVSTIAVTNAASIQPAYDLVVHVPVPTMPVGAEVRIATSANPDQIIGISRLETLDAYGWWAIVKVPAGAGDICFSATGMMKSSACVNPVLTRQAWLDANGVPYLSRVQAAKNIKVHLTTTNKTSRFAVLNVAGVNQSAAFVKVGSTDFVATFTVSANTTKYTIKTQTTKSKKLYDDTEPVQGDASVVSEIYLTSGLGHIYDSNAARTNTVYIHYHRSDNTYKSWGLHTWFSDQYGGAATETTWARPKLPVSSKPDSWGVTFKIPVASFSTKLPYIIHKADIKDPVANQDVDFSLNGYEIWIESGKLDVDGNYQVSNPPLPGDSNATEEISIAEAEALAGTSERSSFAADSIYFVMTDRYKDGDASNNTGGINSTNRAVTGYDPKDYVWSHGGDLAGLSDGCNKTDGSGEGLPRIKNLGFTAIWITPPFKQQFIQGQSAGFHGYWINDFTTIDPHWGTNAQFKSFVDCAHRLGMKVVVDIVMNHTGDVISYRDGNYNFHNQPNSTAYIPSWGTSIKSPSWLNDLSNYHNQGNVQDWSIIGQYQNGDFFGLDDIKTENQVVVDGFADVYSTWVNDFGVDGFRVDTAKHVDNQFFGKWFPKMVEQTSSSMNAKNQKLFAFGEYYEANTGTLSNFMRKYGLPSALDFAFQAKAVNFASGAIASNLSSVFDNDNNFITKTKSPYDLVTFLGNHDMGRIGWLLNQTGTTRAQSSLLAHDIMFLTRGIPSVYYGDEVGMIGSGGDKAARQDMFPTQVTQWKSEDRIWGNPVYDKSSLTITTPLTNRITLLNSLRKQHPALATGSQTQRLVETNSLVVSRFDPVSRTEYLVGFNSGSSAKTVKITSSTPSASWQSLLSSATVTSNSLGELSFSIPARSTVIYKAGSTLPAADETVSVGLNVNLSIGSQSFVLNSSVPGNDLGTVTFVAKVGNGPWQSLGSDDSRGFGMTWDYQPFVGDGVAYGSKVSFAAIYRSSSGTTSVSGIKTLTISY